jgi:hypothetical protein
VLGDDREAFAAAVRKRLAAYGEEPFVQDVRVEVLSGHVR